jgi:hypothetical protein
MAGAPRGGSGGDDLLELLWGSVPIVCELEGGPKQGSGSFAAAPVCSFMVPRQGYLFLIMDHIKSEFANHIAQEGSLWLSHDGVAVPWQHPVSACLDEAACRLGIEGVDAILPLKLVAHVGKDTPEAIQGFSDSRLSRLMIYERMKASLMARFGSTAAMRQLRDKRRVDYDTLFTAIKNNEPRSFAAAKRRLDVTAMSLADTSDGASAPGGAGQFGADDGAAIAGSSRQLSTVPREAFIPIILHRPGAVGRKLAVRRVPASKRSFGAVLKELLPVELEHLTPEQCYSDERLPFPAIALVQGLSPLLSSPIDGLYEALACVDGFLHVSVALS